MSVNRLARSKLAKENEPEGSSMDFPSTRRINN